MHLPIRFHQIVRFLLAVVGKYMSIPNTSSTLSSFPFPPCDHIRIESFLPVEKLLEPQPDWVLSTLTCLPSPSPFCPECYHVNSSIPTCRQTAGTSAWLGPQHPHLPPLPLPFCPECYHVNSSIPTCRQLLEPQPDWVLSTLTCLPSPSPSAPSVTMWIVAFLPVDNCWNLSLTGSSAPSPASPPLPLCPECYHVNSSIPTCRQTAGTSAWPGTPSSWSWWSPACPCTAAETGLSQHQTPSVTSHCLAWYSGQRRDYT